MTDTEREEPQDIRSQAVKFLIVGVFSAGTHYAIYMGLILLASVDEVPATLVGFVISTIVSYVANSTFTFQATQTPETFVRFWLVTLTGGGINAAVVWAAVRVGVHFAIAGIVAIGVAATFNFLSHRYWTFAKRPEIVE